jgi:hypothetical protein
MKILVGHIIPRLLDVVSADPALWDARVKRSSL